MGMYWVCNPKKLGFYGYVLGMKPKKFWVLWVWVGHWVPYPIPTQKPNYFWVPLSDSDRLVNSSCILVE